MNGAHFLLMAVIVFIAAALVLEQALEWVDRLAVWLEKWGW